jgi:hypothetical protein
LGEIRLLNRQIEDVNIQNGVENNAYQVDCGDIVVTHKLLVKAIDNVKNGIISKEAAQKGADDWFNSLARYFKENKRQQPVEWAEMVVDLLTRAIAEMPDDPVIPPKRFQPNGASRKDAPQESRSSHTLNAWRNRSFPDFGKQPEKTELDDHSMSSGLVQEVPVREYPGPGFTRRAHTILGYRPVYREYINRHGEREQVLERARFLVEDDNDQNGNYLRVLDKDEVGKGPARDYDKLPEEKKNDLRASHGKYKLMDATQFKRIVGIDFKGQGSFDRSPETWVQVELWNEPEDPLLANRPHLMTRTELKEWLGIKIGDYEIDQYLTKKNMVPPWAMDSGEPIYNHGYTKLNFPHPATVKRQRMKEIQYSGLMRYQHPMNNDEMYNHSRYLPAPASQGALQRSSDFDDLNLRVQELTIGFQKLLEHLQLSTS